MIMDFIKSIFTAIVIFVLSIIVLIIGFMLDTFKPIKQNLIDY